jgi:uncharacterized Ntn-hydrolase superfamily protein
MSSHYTQIYNTYSIIARDAETGQLGVAVQTHQIGVGRVVPWAMPGVGAIATQSLTNIAFGAMGMSLLRAGIAAPQVVEALAATDSNLSRRQFAVIDANGRTGAFTGTGCIREAGHFAGDGYSVQANMMARKTVILAMREAYQQTKGDLATRMLAVLFAAQREGGDLRGMQSAALKIVPGSKDAPDWQTDYDIRVDEHHSPLDELARLVSIRQAQLIDADGHRLLQNGDVTTALARWKQAREAAPNQEEIPFWQAVALADARPDTQSLSIAARILALALEDNDRRDHWLDLVGRLEECGFIQRKGAAQELLTALKAT